MPTCGCILLNAPGREHPWNAKGKCGADAIRPYTPISDSDVVDGKFQLLIKRLVDFAFQFVWLWLQITDRYREWGTPPTENEGLALHENYRPGDGFPRDFMHHEVMLPFLQPVPYQTTYSSWCPGQIAQNSRIERQMSRFNIPFRG